MFGIGVGIRVGGRTAVSSGGGYDPDAQAFFDRVTTAGGTLTTTEKNAVNQLVLDMKSAGIWTSMKAIYPMVGASAAACAQNLKSASFTGTFTSGWTFASTGVTPNGTSAYMGTSLIPNNELSLNSQHLSFYSRTNSSVLSCLFGATHSITTSRTQLVPKYNVFDYSSINFLPSPVSVSYTTNAFFILSQTTSTSNKLYRNSTIEITRTNTTTDNVDRSLYISARNDGIATIFDNKECAFASIGDGLTDTQASNFYTAVQAFQTTLSRQV